MAGRSTTGQAILRLIGLWIGLAVFYIGVIWIFVDKRKRGWQDLIGGTVVIEQPADRLHLLTRSADPPGERAPRWYPDRPERWPSG